VGHIVKNIQLDDHSALAFFMSGSFVRGNKAGSALEILCQKDVGLSCSSGVLSWMVAGQIFVLFICPPLVFS